MFQASRTQVGTGRFPLPSLCQAVIPARPGNRPHGLSAIHQRQPFGNRDEFAARIHALRAEATNEQITHRRHE